MNSRVTRRGAGFAVMIALVVMVTSCSSAVPTETPGVERLGQYLLRQNGEEAEVVVGYKFASQNLANEWLLLEVAVSAPIGQTARVLRENIWVRTPDGVRIPAATQKAFGQAFAGIRNQISQANVVRDPMDYWPPNRQQCSIQLFMAPGEGVAFDEFTVNDRRVCQGKLFFNVPGGVQPGRWVFAIDLPETDIRIPFEMEG